MTDNNMWNDRAFELYRAVSDVDEKYVGEMLDDDLAESIRAANRRRRITFRSSVTAAAAVFVLVIGLGLVPRLGGISKSEYAAKEADHANVAAPETQAAEQNDEDFTGDAPKDFEGAEMDAAPEYNNETEDAEAAEDNFAGAAPEAEADEAQPERSTPSGKTAENYNAGEYKKIDLLTLPDGRSYDIYKGFVITQDMLGDTIAEADEYILYELAGIDPELGAAAYDTETETYRLAVSDSTTPEEILLLLSER